MIRDLCIVPTTQSQVVFVTIYLVYAVFDNLIYNSHQN